MTVPTLPERILLVEQDPKLRKLLGDVLAAHDYEVLPSGSAREAFEVLQREPVDLVITELQMEGMGGEQLLKQVRAMFPGLPVIGVTAFGTPEEAAALTRAGAADYLTKPFRTPALLSAIARVLEETRPQREQSRLHRQMGKHLAGLIGRSRPMAQLFERIGRVAASRAPVLITGETGTGKELVAQAVHRASGRGQFVALNCGAIPAHLLESELFGHTKGAFTSADRDKQGLFEVADGGTLFLDEIAEMPLALQPKLLRVLQFGELRRVGSVEAKQVDVRIIAASHRDLATEVRENRFREDLFFRINVLRLDVPPLRERRADIPLLVERFLDRIAEREGRSALQIEPNALAALVAYDWPGNVRELLNVVERAAIFAERSEITLDDLPDELRAAAPVGATNGTLPHAPAGTDIVAGAAERGLTLEQLEREYILEVLRRANGNRTRAAKMLGIPRRTLYRRLTEYGVLVDR
jgi:DNA-binding NtrC family response regulator